MITSIRARAAVATSASAVLLLGSCGREVEGSASPSSSPDASSAAPSSSAETDGQSLEDLSPGLLPADAFGAGAVAMPVSKAELEQGAALAGDPADLTITPESCAQAVQGSQPGVEDVENFAAQNVQGGETISVELISIGGSGGDPVGSIADAASSCPEAAISSPDIGTATITFTALDVPDLGDGSAAVVYSTTVTGPDGTPVSVPTVIGMVQDGDRLLTLLSLSVTGSVDTEGFPALLQQAYEYQADALG